jgi:hypothetical protein
MREEFLEFLARVNQNTTLDELQQNCQTQEELGWALKIAQMDTKNEQEEIGLDWKKKALKAFDNIQPWKITTQSVQIKLSVGYHLARKIKDWLLEVQALW